MTQNINSLDVRKLCAAYDQAKVDLTNRRHVLRLLEAEGHKRLEGFIFEHIFNDAVQHSFDPAVLSVGWYFQFDSNDRPLHWFHLQFKSSPTPADQLVSKWLLATGMNVYHVYFDEVKKGFLGYQKHLERDGETLPLTELLERVTEGRPVSPRNYSGVDEARQRDAIRHLETRLSDRQLLELGASRIFVNCFLYPWFGKQPMDIDACLLIDGSLVVSEFKRKYPAANGTFGLDENPHGKLCDWLGQQGASFAHVIMVTPIWKSSWSPLRMLEEGSAIAEYVCWIGAFLTRSSFQGGYLFTSGRDSGMLGGERSQRILSPSSFFELGIGTYPNLESLAALFTGEKPLQPVRMERLVQLRDSASQAPRRG